MLKALFTKITNKNFDWVLGQNMVDEFRVMELQLDQAGMLVSAQVKLK